MQSWDLGRRIVCNEDSQAISQLQVAFRAGVLWGYHDNMTKQKPPTDWSITEGEDTFFAHRLAEGLGIDAPLSAASPIHVERQYTLQGLEPGWEYGGQRWIRLASLYPETIDSVDFYCNDELVYSAYDELFGVYFQSNWRQGGWTVRPEDREWKAVAHLTQSFTEETRRGIERNRAILRDTLCVLCEPLCSVFQYSPSPTPG